MNTEASNIPKISVLMLAYNEERYIAETIESILNQTFKDFEFIIVNDGSTDKTEDIILSFHDPRIRLINNHVNLGLTISLNKGLSIAKANLIARQDGNDISCTKRLEKQLEFMNANPEVVVLGTNAKYINEKGKKIRRFGIYRPKVPTDIITTPAAF